MDARLNKAIKLRENGKLKEANSLLLLLVNEFPDDAYINYQCAWSFDVLGLEKEAIPFYEKAIEIGLRETDLIEAYLGLGSTYRTIGEYRKSKELLQRAIRKYDDNSLKVFLSMTLYNLGEHTESMRILLRIVAETSSDKSILDFKKAIVYYSDKLDKLW